MSVRKPKKKKVKKNIPVGKCHIQAGFGNTQVTFTDPNGGVICWSSAGVLGFKGSRKGAKECGVKTVSVFLKGPGAGREMAIRTISQAGLKIITLRDITPIPHNGCRPPKRRRI